MAHRQAGHQLVHLAGREQTQTAMAAAAIAIEVIHSTEVRIGMVMAAHHLPGLAHHRPTALQMQRHLRAGRNPGRRDRSGHGRRSRHQRRKDRVAVQLPHPIEVPGPGAAGIGVGGRLTAQLTDRLNLQSRVERIDRSLHLAERRGEEGLDLQASQWGRPMAWGSSTRARS